ncbi:AAA family ATPase [Megalodesulfovibrio paquesii]
MSTQECTLLQCFVENGLPAAVAPIYRTLEVDEKGQFALEALLTAREEVTQAAAGQSRMVLDRILDFQGRKTPFLMPKDFRAAARRHPWLLLYSPLARYYPEALEPETSLSGQRPDAAIRYFLPQEADTADRGARQVTVLLKDFASDAYNLVPLLVMDEEEPAAGILLYLKERTDGRYAPVAVFGGEVERAFQSAPVQTSSSAPTAPPPRRHIADPLGRAMAVLLDVALEREGLLPVETGAPRVPLGRGLSWLAARMADREVVALTTDIPFAEQPLLRLLQQDVRLPLVNATILGPTEPVLQLPCPSRASLVVLSMTAYPRLADAERVAHDLASGEHAVLITCTSMKALPDAIHALTEWDIALPRVDWEIFGRLFAAIFEADPPQHEDPPTWIRYVLPVDLARVARLETDPAKAFALLAQRVEERLTRLTPQHGPSLQDLCGLGEAKVRAEQLIADIRSALAGDIAWSMVDRGMLLVGPPGCGKTSLARAIAKDCGVHFLESSATAWQMAGYLNDHLSAMARDFQEARRFAPSILFIDELDSIGSRESFSGSNAAYHTQVVNALLAELQGFSDRDKVFVIAATNHVAGVDPALRRAGRLDRVVEVSLPTMDALEKIFAYYLERQQVPETVRATLTLRPLAEAAFGKTGADVSLAVRGALRRARLACRPLCQDDLLAELYNRPLENDFARPLRGESLRRVAIHEAGHAVLRLTSNGALGGVAYMSIVPRPDGSLGFMAAQPDPDTSVRTRADYLALITTILGGRAAEEVFYGPEAVGAGAGGSSASDLARAMALALDMVCRLGLGSDQRLCWRETPTRDDIREAEQLLADAYTQARDTIRDQRHTVQHIATALVARQELSGEELRQLLDGMGR